MSLIEMKNLILHIFLFLFLFKPFSSHALPSIETLSTKAPQHLMAQEMNPQPLRNSVKRHNQYESFHKLTPVAEEAPETFLSERWQPELSRWINMESDVSKMDPSETLLNGDDPKSDLIIRDVGSQLKRSNAQKGWFDQNQLSEILKGFNQEVVIINSPQYEDQRRASLFMKLRHKKEYLPKLKNSCCPIFKMNEHERT
ncbi:hypothetical protein DFH28DRAFT_965088 [Melampsora americana]|nr:hypothetical protein DFH28DRAFT_965088 [Melampsora americana]